MLRCVRPVFLDIRRVERCLRVWPSWLSGPTSSSTAVTFSSIRVCFGLPLSCLWSVLLVPPESSFSKAFSLSLLQFVVENHASILREPYPLNRCKLFTSALSSMLNGMLHYCYFVTALQIIMYNNIVCFFLFTNTGNLFKTKHNLI